MNHWLQKLKIDRFLVMLIGVIVLASVLPVQGEVKVGFEYLTTAAIALLFFMHGAKLSREAIKQGMGHWRLHLLVFVGALLLVPFWGLALHGWVPACMSLTV